MRSERSAFLAGIVVLLLGGCGEGSFTNKVSLPLTRVDGQSLPVALPSGTGTVQVVSGSLLGSQVGVECTWVLNLSSGSSPTGMVSNCSIAITEVVTLELDLGGPPGPSGSHSYQFGFSSG